MTTEAKVGAFTMGGIALLVVLMMQLSGFSFGGAKGYAIYAGFPQVIGLEPQASVKLAGVPVGSVERIANEGGGVMLKLQIENNVKIPVGSKVGIAAAGVMGEKFVNITPAEDRGAYISPEAYLVGVPEAGMDTMFEGMAKTMEQVQALLVSMNEVVGDRGFQSSLIGMSENLRDASLHASVMLASMERMAVNNEANVNQMAGNLAAATASMQRTMTSVEQSMANLNSAFGDPQTAANLKATLENIAQTSARVERMAANMEKVAGDPQTAEDLRATIHNARALSDKAGKLMGAVGDMKISPSVDLLYSGSAHDWKTNVAIEAGADRGTYGKLGVDDVGEGSRLNAQIGTRSAYAGIRAGAVAGKPGVGVDAYPGKRWTLSAEAYDPDDMTLRLRAAYEIQDGTYLMGQMDDAASGKRRQTYFGIRQRF